MQTVKGILYFALFLSNLARPDDTYNLARAIEGERPDLVCPDVYTPVCQELADRVGIVALNRLDAKWCDTICSCVDGGFWGAQDVVYPQRWAVESAQRILESPARNGDFYVFSVHDRAELGLEKGDANFSFESGQYGLYFYGPNTQW